MKHKKRNREVFSEHSYWQSYSDMLAALLLFFILIIAVTMAVYKQKTEDLKVTEAELYDAKAQLELTLADLSKSNEELKVSLEQLQKAYDQRALTQEELEVAYLEVESARKELAETKSQLQDIVGIRTDIIKELQSAFDEQSMTVDSQTGSITFSSDVLFRYNSATLTEESQNILKAVIPKYLSVLLQEQYKDYIAEIIIEGHTDTIGDYQSNMELSLNRANSVAKFCLDEQNGLSTAHIEQLQGVLTVNGRSYSAPVYKEDGEADMDSSRRVEIKFRLKEEEMIEKLSQLIVQESESAENTEESEETTKMAESVKESEQETKTAESAKESEQEAKIAESAKVIGKNADSEIEVTIEEIRE